MAAKKFLPLFTFTEDTLEVDLERGRQGGNGENAEWEKSINRMDTTSGNIYIYTKIIIILQVMMLVEAWTCSK